MTLVKNFVKSAKKEEEGDSENSRKISYLNKMHL